MAQSVAKDRRGFFRLLQPVQFLFLNKYSGKKRLLAISGGFH